MEKSLSFEQIAAATDLVEEVVQVPEWGGAVTLRSLSVAQRMEIGDYVEQNEKANLMSIIVGRSIIDGETGERLSMDQALRLVDKSGEVISRLSVKVNKMSSLGREADEAAKKD